MSCYITYDKHQYNNFSWRCVLTILCSLKSLKIFLSILEVLFFKNSNPYKLHLLYTYYFLFYLTEIHNTNLCLCLCRDKYFLFSYLMTCNYGQKIIGISRKYCNYIAWMESAAISKTMIHHKIYFFRNYYNCALRERFLRSNVS